MWRDFLITTQAAKRDAFLVARDQATVALVQTAQSPRPASPLEQQEISATGIPPATTAVSIARQAPPSHTQVRTLRGSAWLLWREKGASTALANAGQLGGSQAGVRIDKTLGNLAGHGVSAYGRLSAALVRPYTPEAAAGVSWQARAGSVPATIGVERRISLGRGGRDAFAVIMTSGTGPRRVIGPMLLEAYGQTGIVGAARRDIFADGRLTLSYPLSGTRARLGLSASGGFQPHVARLGIGPRAELPLTLGRADARLSVEWRQRVAGHARPGSGLALTLASDF
jgi:hypothetical protein